MPLRCGIKGCTTVWPSHDTLSAHKISSNFCPKEGCSTITVNSKSLQTHLNTCHKDNVGIEKTSGEFVVYFFDSFKLSLTYLSIVHFRPACHHSPWRQGHF